MNSVRSQLIALLDPPSLRSFARRLTGADIRLALRLCLPAAIVALVLRAVLMASMPAAFVHNDTCASLKTAERLVSHGALVLDVKKTLLAPTLYCVPAVLHLPVLPFVAVVQHLLGVALVFLVGLLTFAWLRNWRALILPSTLCTALNPVLLWYEHTALAESFAVFGIVLLALAATVFWRAPNRYSLAILFLALLFLALARPEGGLFAFFVIVLVIRTLWGNGRALRIGLGLTLVWTIPLLALTRTGQGGLLLFTSVLHLTPGQLILSPGVAEHVRPLVEFARAQWNSARAPHLVPLRKALEKSLHEITPRPDATARRAGIETALRNLPALPGLALRKFVIAHRELPCGEFNAYALDGQFDVLTRDGANSRPMRYSPLLWGRPLHSADEVRSFLAANYHPIPGDFLTRWLNAWQSVSLLPIAPVSLPGSEISNVPIVGLPWLYAAALVGLLCLALRDPRPLNFHQLWGAFLIGLFILLMVTANIRARFRLLFEPFWILYALALLDSALILARRLSVRKNFLSS